MDLQALSACAPPCRVHPSDRRRAHAETAVIDIEVGIGAGSVVLVLPEGWAANAERLKKGVGEVKVKVAPTPASDCPTIFLHGQAGLGS